MESGSNFGVCCFGGRRHEAILSGKTQGMEDAVYTIQRPWGFRKRFISFNAVRCDLSFKGRPLGLFEKQLHLQ